jgi:hypothetical protein
MALASVGCPIPFNGDIGDGAITDQEKAPAGHEAVWVQRGSHFLLLDPMQPLPPITRRFIPIRATSVPLPDENRTRMEDSFPIA